MSSTNNNNNSSIAAENLLSATEEINFLADSEGNIILNIPVVQNISQSSQLDELLETFNLGEVKPYLTSKYIY